MHVCPKDFKDTEKKIRAYIQDGVKAGVFSVTRGRGAGIGRVCDIPVLALPGPKTKRASKASSATEAK